ncbi:helix-turn-helix domain-containing protein [Anaerobacillus alkaliphilus]|uniref:Helix-turn-helix domain-containing protein n=1 Tax=Anaerobacillus alkaliphilus TaxID=1548597 RepID=A0A4Q0VN90_9BACI|nr:helix-turn-helix domain-containing protein [Anaerobacillus alkaliphilus]RXI96235.1 helix-turn-helix domain-containing protein [Anaerobacillus alkaliphilus]
MDKQQLIEVISKKMKLIRVESGYSQFKMAEIIGISKKTLVQIEKDRTLVSWTHVIALCALFRKSEILQTTLGSDPLELIEIYAYETVASPKEKTMGGKVWWKEITRKYNFRIQQNLVSQHYRIVDDEDYRWFSSFSEEETSQHLEELTKSNR